MALLHSFFFKVLNTYKYVKQHTLKDRILSKTYDTALFLSDFNANILNIWEETGKL